MITTEIFDSTFTIISLGIHPNKRVWTLSRPENLERVKDFINHMNIKGVFYVEQPLTGYNDFITVR